MKCLHIPIRPPSHFAHHTIWSPGAARPWLSLKPRPGAPLHRAVGCIELLTSRPVVETRYERPLPFTNLRDSQLTAVPRLPIHQPSRQSALGLDILDTARAVWGPHERLHADCRVLPNVAHEEPQV